MNRFLPLFLLFLSSCSVQPKDVAKFHQKATVIDTHNDVLSAAIVHGIDLNKDLTGLYHSDFNRFKKGGVDIQVFSIWMSGKEYGNGTAFAYAKRQIDSMRAVTLRNSDKLAWVTNSIQLQQAIYDDKLGVMLGLEGGYPIEDKLDNIDSLSALGVRYITLTWNESTTWATSAADETDTSKTLPFKGLTEFGKDVVRRMNKLKIMVDLSHVGEQTFYDAIKVSSKPIIVSHSCVYSICPSPRNLKDAQIEAVKKNNGVIFVNFYSGFLDKDYPKKLDKFLGNHKTEYDSLLSTGLDSFDINKILSNTYKEEFKQVQAPISLLADHIDYIVKKIGVNHVGLGSDYDGIDATPRNMDDVSTYLRLTQELFNRDYSEGDLKKILGENFIRVLKANE